MNIIYETKTDSQIQRIDLWLPRRWGSGGEKEGKENKNILFLTSLAFKWLGLWALTAEGVGSIPGQGRSGNCCMERPKKKRKEKKKKNSLLF